MPPLSSPSAVSVQCREGRRASVLWGWAAQGQASQQPGGWEERSSSLDGSLRTASGCVGPVSRPGALAVYHTCGCSAGSLWPLPAPMTQGRENGARPPPHAQLHSCGQYSACLGFRAQVAERGIAPCRDQSLEGHDPTSFSHWASWCLQHGGGSPPLGWHCHASCMPTGVPGS